MELESEQAKNFKTIKREDALPVEMIQGIEHLDDVDEDASRTEVKEEDVSPAPTGIESDSENSTEPTEDVPRRNTRAASKAQKAPLIEKLKSSAPDSSSSETTPTPGMKLLTFGEDHDVDIDDGVSEVLAPGPITGKKGKKKAISNADRDGATMRGAGSRAHGRGTGRGRGRG